MDPRNRKLFKSRDARTKLRDMGGIMSSSPELAQTVQRFQEGGRVTGLEQMEADPIRDGRGARVDGVTYVMLPNGVVLNARTQAPASAEVTLTVQRKLNAFPERDPVLSEENLAMRVNPSFETDMRDRSFGIGVSDVMPDPSFMDSSSAYLGEEIGFPDVSAYRTAPNMPGVVETDNLMFQRQGPAGPPLSADVFSQLQGLGIDPVDFQNLTPEEQDGILNFEDLPFTPMQTEPANPNSLGTSISRSVNDWVGGALGGRTIGAQKEIDIKRAQSDARVDPMDLRDDAKAERGFGRTDDSSGRVGLGAGARAGAGAGTDADADAPARAGAGTGTGTVDSDRLNALMPDPNDTDDDIRAKYKDRLALMQEVLGENEAGARNKSMDLAMIGLAIMSGQSPNALTNIGQGAAAGLQAMSARDEAARERQRLIRTSALEGVLDEEAAASAAAATAAEKAADRQNRLDAARIRNSTDLDTKTGEVTYRALFQEAYKVATSILDMPEEVKSGELSATEYADRVAKAALAGSQGATVAPAIPRRARTPEQIQSVVQERVDAAKDNPAMLEAIKQQLIALGGDPSKYGLK